MSIIHRVCQGGPLCVEYLEKFIKLRPGWFGINYHQSRHRRISCVNMICRISDPTRWSDAVKMLQLILDHEEELQIDKRVDWNSCFVEAAGYSGVELIKLIHENKEISLDRENKAGLEYFVKNRTI